MAPQRYFWVVCNGRGYERESLDGIDLAPYAESPDLMGWWAVQEASVPELYADGVQIGLSPFGVTLSFAMQPAGQTGAMAPIKVCNLRMSLEHAKVLAMMLRKQLKNFEEQMGDDIPLHPQLYQQLGLSKMEDW